MPAIDRSLSDIDCRYGIREYSRGVVLKRHVDRVQSHVLSAILNIAQRGMNSHWCLTINDHDGVEHQLNLLPGEMLLYESAALVHGQLMFNNQFFNLKRRYFY